ncbi:hypothetical protein SMMN14_08766, partial [Sphaerulina musiva]
KRRLNHPSHSACKCRHNHPSHSASSSNKYMILYMLTATTEAASVCTRTQQSCLGWHSGGAPPCPLHAVSSEPCTTHRQRISKRCAWKWDVSTVISFLHWSIY